MEDIEVWRDINGFEGLYQVSNLGRVRSITKTITSKNGKCMHFAGKILKLLLRKDYYNVNLYKNRKLYGRRINRLVAFAFPEICGEWFEGAVVNHKNEIKTDNRAENLEWCTQKHNCNYGTHSEKMSMSKQKPIIAYNEHEEIRFDSINAAAEYFSCPANCVSAVLNNYRYRHSLHGYKIKRAV